MTPPTNAIQRAIWDKVHQILDKPIKIEFDPKKDKYGTGSRTEAAKRRSTK